MPVWGFHKSYYFCTCSKTYLNISLSHTRHANQRITNSRNNIFGGGTTATLRLLLNHALSLDSRWVLGSKHSIYHLWTKKTCEAWLNWIFSTMESLFSSSCWVPWCLLFETPNLLFFFIIFWTTVNWDHVKNWPVINHRFFSFWESFRLVGKIFANKSTFLLGSDPIIGP